MSPMPVAVLTSSCKDVLETLEKMNHKLDKPEKKSCKLKKRKHNYLSDSTNDS
jgi:hypothetical protein